MLDLKKKKTKKTQQKHKTPFYLQHKFEFESTLSVNCFHPCSPQPPKKKGQVMEY